MSNLHLDISTFSINGGGVRNEKEIGEISVGDFIKRVEKIISSRSLTL